MKKRRYWAVVKTKQAASGDAVRNVTVQGFEVCHLMYRQRPERGVRRIMPLFPFYLLVRIDLLRNWRVLASTRGISHLFMNGDEPSRVPDEDVQRFRELENELGYVVDPEHEAPRFRERESVRGMSGLFEGCHGVYQGLAGASHERVRVLFSILGKSRVFEMKARDLASAA